MVQIGRKMGEIWPKSWRFWRIFEAQMAKTPKTNLGTLQNIDENSTQFDLILNSVSFRFRSVKDVSIWNVAESIKTPFVQYKAVTKTNEFFAR